MLIGARPTLGRNEDEHRSCRSPGRDRRHGTRRTRTVPGALGGDRRVARRPVRRRARRTSSAHRRPHCWRSAATGGASWRRSATSTWCSCTTSTAARVEPFASAIWYPLWDAGSKLGHAVRTVNDQLDLAKSDLDTATALLTARLIAGDAALAAKVIDAGRSNWTKHSKRWLGELQLRVRERQLGAGEVAYTLEPDLKDGHGGLRDVQSLWWAAHGRAGVAERRRRRARRVLRHAGAGSGRAASRHRSGGRRAASRGSGRGGRPIRARHRRRADGRRRRGRRGRSRGSPTRRGAGSSARSVASPIASPPA